MVDMSDRMLSKSLYRTAESQAGFFTAVQAIEAGIARSTLAYHARPDGRFERLGSGLYRLKYFPEGVNDHIMAAWLPLKGAGAVVSHQSALQLHDLSDLSPGVVHLTVPRDKRGARPRVGVRLHTSEDFPASAELRAVDGLPVTSVERTIIDLLAAGERTEQLEMAVHQAIDRGISTPRRLCQAVEIGSLSARRFIEALVAAGAT